jgi:hypothetical protein
VTFVLLSIGFFLVFRALERRRVRRAGRHRIVSAARVGGAYSLQVHGRTRVMVIPVPGWPRPALTYRSGALVVRV